MEKLCLPLVFLFAQRVMADLRIGQRPQTTSRGSSNLDGHSRVNIMRDIVMGGVTGSELYMGGGFNGAVPIYPNTTLPRNKYCLSPGDADLSKPGYEVANRGYQCFIGPGSRGAKIHLKWQEPSTFNYTGLGKFLTPGKPDHRPGAMAPTFEHVQLNKGQKGNNYDQFLRSNIDNEQDNRDFNQDDGHDHLPFRSWNSEIRPWNIHMGNCKAQGRECYLAATVEPGDSRIVPLRWNNPHAAELEVNIWIQQHSGGKPIVVPIRKPTCSGEGYGDQIIKFTIPEDFEELASKIPGFKGCNEDSKPMCVLQVYAHSVESRTYSSAFPIVIPGNYSDKPASRRRRRRGRAPKSFTIEAAQKDPWLDLTHLREICRPSNDPDANIKKAVPRWARLVSDVYNHAYQNSDFSPYSGQQQESISQNLQASAINKMVTGDRGELGKQILTSEQRGRITQLQALEDRIYKNYEALALKIIYKVGDEMKTTAVFDTTRKGEVMVEGASEKHGNLRVVLEHCFRCAETGSMEKVRQTTNTYIPSFQLAQNLIGKARSLLPRKYGDLISPTGIVQIYKQSLLDLLPFFAVSHPYGIIYQAAMIKNTLLTMPDVTKFKKVGPTGTLDAGTYASVSAKTEFAKSLGCPMTCLMPKGWAKGYEKPLLKGAPGHSQSFRSPLNPVGTKVTGECSGCKAFFTGFPNDPSFQPGLTSLATSIVKEGLPDGMTGVTAYADPDGSPRIARAPLPGETVPTRPPGVPLQPDWDKQVTEGPPTSAPPPGQTPPPNQDNPPSKTRRRRRTSSSGGCAKLSACISRCPEDPVSFKGCVRTCQSLGESDKRPTRRRRGSARRRRKTVSLQELFDHVAAQHKL